MEPTTITITFEVRPQSTEQAVLDTFKRHVLDQQPYSWHVDEVYLPPKE